MPTNYSWITLPGDIQYKQQNYYGSCFAAAYQNLYANLPFSRNRRQLDDSIEKLEYQYMYDKHECDIDQVNVAPNIIDVVSFVAEELSTSEICHFNFTPDITEDELVILGTKKNGNIGYILSVNNHAHALFVKQINSIDYYIALDSNLNYTYDDFCYYASPCANGIQSLGHLQLLSNESKTKGFAGFKVTCRR